jgi:hypothetical protein
MIYENFNFSPWYNGSPLIGLLKNLHQVNIEDYDDVAFAIFSFEEIGKGLFRILNEHDTLLDNTQYDTIETIYWKSVNQLKQHEGTDFHKAKKAFATAKSTVIYLIDLLLYDYHVSGMICEEMREAMNSIRASNYPYLNK